MLMHSASGRHRGARTRKIVWQLSVTAILAAVLCGCATTSGTTNAKSDTPGGGGIGGRRGAGGDVPVTVANAVQRDVPVEVQVIGHVEAYSTITVKAQASGQLTDVYFHEGDVVHKGEKLFTIDKRPLEAAYQQATVL